MSGYAVGMTLQHLPTDDHSIAVAVSRLSERAVQYRMRDFPTKRGQGRPRNVNVAA